MPRCPTACVAALAIVLMIAGCSSTASNRLSTSEPAPPTVSTPTRASSTASSTARTSTAARTSPAKRTSSIRPVAPTTAPPSTTGGVLIALAGLLIKGRAPMTGYSRAQFGPAWSDDTIEPFGHNGCDTRNDVLRRDLRSASIKPGTNGCVVLSGTLHDPYTATVIAFRRGSATSSKVQIDHVVALGDAWQTGAQQWSADQRQRLANDPLNLIAVDGPTNEQKGDADAASWLPPNKAFRCAYVARQVAVKSKYRLWMTRAEHDASAGVLARCPGLALPVEPGRVGSVAGQPSSAAPTTGPRTTPPAAPPGGSGVYYANCAAVRVAGKAPLRRGQPGYRSGLDGDHDGVACE